MSEYENPNTPFEQTQNTQRKKLVDGCLGAGCGCIGSALYFLAMVVFSMFLAASKKIELDNLESVLAFDILALVGLIPAFYYTKKNNKAYWFWGFIVSYMLVMLLGARDLFIGLINFTD